MQATHQGLLSSTMGKLLPLSDFLERVGVRSIVIQATSYAIRDYQRYISPYKGFSCAHRKLHGGESCSAYFHQVVISYGLSQAIPLFQKRLEACRESYNLLRMSMAEQEETDPEHDMEPSQEDQGQLREPAPKKPSRADWFNSSSGDCSGCSCGDGHTHGWAPCDTNHDGVSDLGDCSGCDMPCDGVDLGGCDCNL